MSGEFSAAPAREGVFGPEVWLNVRSGRSCLRPDGAVFQGPLPDAPVTNAFVAWVGRPVIVVSVGVDPGDFGAVAGALRGAVGVDDAPVVFTLGRGADDCVRAAAVCVEAGLGRENARALAYVLVQCGWFEDEFIRVELDGEAFAFRLEFVPVSDGKSTPLLT